jgi:hypothetical protein
VLWQACDAVLEKGISEADVNITYNYKQAIEHNKVSGYYNVCYQGWREINARNANGGDHKDNKVQDNTKV